MPDSAPVRLFEAVATGDDAEVLSCLTTGGVDIHTVEHHYGDTALHVATEHARSSTVKLLLERNANPNFANAAQRTPLHIAAMRDSLACARLLITNGGSLEARCSEGRREGVGARRTPPR